MQDYGAIGREFGLWISLVESQCARLQRTEVKASKASRFGTLRLNKAKPVYLSQLAHRGKFDQACDRVDGRPIIFK